MTRFGVLILSLLLLLVACSTGGLKLSLGSSTLPIGENQVDLYLTDDSGKPVTDATVTFDVVHTTMRMEKNLVSTTNKGDGHYVGTVKFTMAGSWIIFVDGKWGDKPLGRHEVKVTIKE
ncbi:MAG: FixH family protein [Chloroflexi bacterium]|nr:FixH family protein [Chloroflexota bacterium]